MSKINCNHAVLALLLAAGSTGYIANAQESNPNRLA